MRRKFAFAVVCALGAVTAPVAATMPGVDVASGRFSIGISGFVPVICRANVDAQLVSPVGGNGSLGSLREFCNSPNGYRVVAQYSPSLATGALVVDGQAIALTEAGEVVVSASETAAITNRTLALELPEGVSDGALSFRIEPR